MVEEDRMPATTILFYCEADGRAPVVQWLEELRRSDPKGYANCIVRIEQLAAFGRELRRPAADYLRDGILELRAKHGHLQLRLLYFFHGRNVTVLAHGLVKQGSAVPKVDIERAIARKLSFERDPQIHTYNEEV
jgi:phage-related protein